MIREVARPFLLCRIGSGTKSLFWHDDWTQLDPLIELSGSNGSRVSGIPKMSTVAQAIQGGSWRLPRGRHPINVLLRDSLGDTTISKSSDVFLWRNTSSGESGQFHYALTWSTLHPLTVLVNWRNTV